MKKLLCTLYLLSASLIALPLTLAEDVVIEDLDAPDATITYVTLAWNPNPEQNILGYNVYYGLVSGSYFRLVTVTETTATIGVKGNKTRYFAVTAFDANGLESDLSEEVHWP
jgi:fibronectin type 3 domain-containing protein